jgi:hypothetical protein
MYLHIISRTSYIGDAKGDMVLNDQHYKKKKSYYHGSSYSGDALKPINISNTSSKVLYITQNPVYAYKNHVNEDGFLYVLRLIRPLNIFSANSKIDLAKLLKYTGNLSPREINMLKKHDWLFFPEFDFVRFSNKGNLIGIIDEELGFDGFYNNEKMENENFRLDGIGLFVDNAIEIIAKYSAEEAMHNIKKLNKYFENRKEIELVNNFLKESGLTEEKRKLLSLNRRLVEKEQIRTMGIIFSELENGLGKLYIAIEKYNHFLEESEIKNQVRIRDATEGDLLKEQITIWTDYIQKRINELKAGAYTEFDTTVSAIKTRNINRYSLNINDIKTGILSYTNLINNLNEVIDSHNKHFQQINRTDQVIDLVWNNFH